MFNYQTRIQTYLIMGIVTLLGLQGQVFGFDLTSEISSKFIKYYNGGYSDEYLESPYNPVYSKDPFGDALSNIEGMSMQMKIAGVQQVENALSEANCAGISQKKVWAMLYYFVPEFRAEIARSLKMELGDASSQNYIFDAETITQYCKEYFQCVNYNANKSDKKDGDNVTTASTPQNIETNCQEFFQRYYNVGMENEKRLQNLQKSQLGSDKFRNATTDDSPYDIMGDLGTVGKLLYEEVEQPITPVFYHLPIFSNSEKSLKNAKQSSAATDSSTSSSNASSSNNSTNPSNSDGSNGASVSLGGILAGNNDSQTNGTQTNGSNSSSTISLAGNTRGFSMEGGYDRLVEGLGAWSVSNNNSVFYGSLCVDEEEEPEPEPEKTTVVRDTISSREPGRDLSNLSSAEYQEVVDYMLDAVDKYTTLPEDKEKEIREKAGDTGRYDSATTEEDLKKAADEIKTCWDSCKGLRIDQKASCMIMCACGEITSADDKILGFKNPMKLFDSEEFPGLGPILIIRYCTVPAVDTRFSVGGKKIISVEEGAKEIFGVVDKLSREGRLGIRTQQYNFLDSTTKKMKFSDMVSFTVDVDRVDVTDRYSKQSEQYQKREISKSNLQRQQDLGISNPLDNPVSKNKYRLVGYAGEIVNDYSSASNADVNRNIQEELNVSPSSLVDQSDNSNSDRYVQISDNISKWIDQQGLFWVDVQGYLEDRADFARFLYAKKG